MKLKVTEVRPGMVYQGEVIVIVEFFGNVARLYLSKGTQITLSKDSYVLIEGEIIEHSN